jgi:hypothetical protein
LDTHERWRQIAHVGRLRCIYALVEKENNNFYLVMTAKVLPQAGKIIEGHGLNDSHRNGSQRAPQGRVK